MLATSRQTQPKVQCIVPTTTNNISRIIQAAIKNWWHQKLMTFKVNGIEYCCWQMLYSSHLEAVIIFFFLREVGDIFYRQSPTESFPVSSSMVASWWPTTFLPLVGPGRTTTIWGFLKATLLTEAVTVSPRVTPVASNFSLPIKTVTTNMHHLSSSAWSDGVRGPASLTTNLVVGATWVSTSIGLVAQPVSRSFGISTSDSVKRTVASLSSRVSAGPGGVCSTSNLEGKVIGSAGGVSEVVLCPPAFCRAWLHVSNSSCGGWGNGVPLGDHCAPAYSFWGNAPQVLEDVSLI